jgi:hypothetical protein
MSDVADYNLIIRRGRTLDKTFTWRSGGALVDLSGYTAKLQIRSKVDDPTVLVELTDGGAANGITLGGVAGTVRIQRTRAQTLLYTFSRAVYDLELLGPGGEPSKTFLEGDVIVKPPVTQ